MAIYVHTNEKPYKAFKLDRYKWCFFHKSATGKTFLHHERFLTKHHAQNVANKWQETNAKLRQRTNCWFCGDRIDYKPAIVDGRPACECCEWQRPEPNITEDSDCLENYMPNEYFTER